MIPGCTGALIAGGRGLRLGGVRKALIEIGGEPIAARILRLFRALFEDTLMVANEEEPYRALGVRIVPDAIPGKGAPGGLHAALQAARTPWVFAAACDMPNLSGGAIHKLAEMRGSAPALIVRWEGHLEPLHAFYATRCLPALDRLLRASDPSFVQLADAVGAQIVGEAEWRAIDPTGASFANVNTHDDLARATSPTPS